MKLYQCTSCGNIGKLDHKHWSRYSSLLLDEIDAGLAIVSCSAACMASASAKIKSKEWQLPVVTSRGWNTRIRKDQVGYHRQPEQHELLLAYNQSE